MDSSKLLTEKWNQASVYNLKIHNQDAYSEVIPSLLIEPWIELPNFVPSVVSYASLR